MTPTEKRSEHLTHGYNRMVERVRSAFEHGTAASLLHAIQLCKDKAFELQELSKEEAERIGDFLHRDVQDAAEYLANSGGDLADWMRFDLELIEERLAESFFIVADRTCIELSQLAEEAQHVGEYLTGDVVGPGSLQCSACDHWVRFQETSQLPVCPACGGGIFKRPPAEQDL